MKLRDIEVANDDYERQARNTTSSLEDMESKYNVAIERGVLLEGEVKAGEQERETLRIENQRLRDELSDLKIETHIVQEKLRKAENSSHKNRSVSHVDFSLPVSRSPEATQHSPATSTSSPTFATPPTKSVSSIASDAPTPPSPPFSESSNGVPKTIATPSVPRPRVSLTESKPLPKRGYHSIRASRHSRNPSIPISHGQVTPSLSTRRSTARLDSSQRAGLPKSGSLYQIRGLIGKMQKLEERVQSARSKLPAPVDTPTRASPRTGSALSQHSIPASVTIRGSRKRTSGSVASSRDEDSTTPSRSAQTQNSSGIPHPTPSRSTVGDSRPSSRTSMSSRSSVGHGTFASGSIPFPRSESRQSAAASRTPLGHYSTNPAAESRRPRSSLSNYSQPGKMSHIDEADVNITTPTPRRGTFNNNYNTAIPTPGSTRKRQSGDTPGTPSMLPAQRRVSSGLERRDGQMGPPVERKKKLSELGETY